MLAGLIVGVAAVVILVTEGDDRRHPCPSGDEAALREVLLFEREILSDPERPIFFQFREHTLLSLDGEQTTVVFDPPIHSVMDVDERLAALDLCEGA